MMVWLIESTKSQCLQKMTKVEAGVKAFQPSNISYHMILKVLRTCVPGKSSLALLIIMLVHEDLRSSAIVSPPFPMMWPETLLKNEIQRSRSDQILHSTLHSTSVSEEPQRFFPKTSTLATSTWESTFSSGCPFLPPGASLRCSRFLSRCQCSSTALP